jgi:predicted RNA binding protein YcfA (HicA-like mRNA interferase family)
MKIREVISMSEADGWILVSQRACHRQYEHPPKRGRVPIPGKTGDNVKIERSRGIKRQASIE